MFSFQYKEILFGLAVALPLALLFVYVLQWKKGVKKKLGDPELISRLTSTYSPLNFSIKFFLKVVAILFCVIAAANLRTPKSANEGNKTGIDVMVAVDVSNSMLAQDIKPNRLERAKQFLNKVVDKIGDNRVGLVVFAGQAYLQMPLSPDLAAAKMYISNLSPDIVPLQGTMLSDALRICNASLNNKEKKYKAIILISDGEDHDEKTGETMQQMVESGVVVHTIGIGSPDGSPIFDPTTNDFKKDVNGNVVISKLNEQILREIASKTQGAYQLLSNADAAATQLVADLDTMEKKNIGGSQHRDFTPYFQWFLLLAVLLLLLETLIPERKMKWI